MAKISQLVAVLMITFASLQSAAAETLGEFPSSNTLWIPITLNLEIDEIRLKFGAPHLRQNAFGNIAITEITETSYQSKKDCEFTLMDLCVADNCDVESLSVGNTQQFVFRNFFPKNRDQGETEYAIFAFCRPYQIFFNNDHEIFKTGF
jgi:hypothetical protein